MRLLFYIQDLDGGGAERVMVTLVNALSSKGHQCTVVKTSNNPNIAYPIREDVNIVDMSVGYPSVSNSIFNKIYRRYWYYHSIRKIAKNNEPNAVISFQATLNNEVLFSLLGTRYPIIVSEHTNVTRKGVGRKHTTFYRGILYHFASVVTVLTRRDLSIWKNKYHHVVYMPNPIDLNPVGERNDRKKIVLAVGEILRWKIKGFDLLFKAWSLIYNDFPEWELHIAGNYDEQSINQLKSYISGSAEKSIRLLGFRRDIGQLMRTSEVYCLSSRVEGLPMGLIEAMSNGCCCVAFDCITGPREIIKDRISGLLAEAENVVDLADKLRTVMSNAQIRTSLASMSRESIEKYSTDRVIKRWELLLKKVIA